MTANALILVLGVFVAFFIDVPVAIALGAVPIVVLLMNDVSLTIVIQRMVAGVNSFPLMAIPFFILAGNLMNTGGITQRIVNFARALVGHIIGGLGHVMIVASMIFAGISGSAVADAAALGSILIPTMIRQGYNKAFAGAVVASAAIIGPIIPPSIPMVVFGVAANVSIGALFLGGAIPGTLMGLFLMIINAFIARKRNYPVEPRPTLKQAAVSFKDAFLALLMPGIILGGVLTGVFTPTESAVFACVYALFVGTVIYRELTWKQIYDAFWESGLGSATVLFVIATASLYGWMLTTEQIPTMVTDWFRSMNMSATALLLWINILLLFVGTFVEATAALIILTPVLVPLVNAAGINPVHFGVVMVLNLMIGLLTPPLGICLFIAADIAKVKLGPIVREAVPFIIALVALLFLITYVPGLVLWLPQVAGQIR